MCSAWKHFLVDDALFVAFGVCLVTVTRAHTWPATCANRLSHLITSDVNIVVILVTDVYALCTTWLCFFLWSCLQCACLVFFNTILSAFTGINKLFPKVMCVLLLLWLKLQHNIISHFVFSIILISIVYFILENLILNAKKCATRRNLQFQGSYHWLAEPQTSKL